MNRTTIARFLALAAGAVLGPAAFAQPFSYFSDFGPAPVGPEWSSTTTSTAPFGNATACSFPDGNFLGEFGNQSVTLTLLNVPGGTYSLTFDLYIIRTWDGGTDQFRVSVAGATPAVPLCTSFRNFGPNNQAYPAFLTACGGTGGNNPAWSGAFSVNTLGFRSGTQQLLNDSTYRFGRCNNDHRLYLTVPTGGSPVVTITFRGILNSALTDESWGLDKVAVTNCIADVDDGCGTGLPDGGVTFDDLIYYLTIFSDGGICADVDDGSATGTPDGGVTTDDLLYYLLRFQNGC